MFLCVLRTHFIFAICGFKTILFENKTTLMGKYDKLIKENLSYLVKSFAERMGIGLQNERLELIKDKLQQTVEREPDFLFIVRHSDPKKDYVSHFDFQVQNDMTMPERMLFYRCLIKYTHNKPVRQIVFYLGNEPLEMVNFLDEPNTTHKFELYDIRIFTANSFLESDIPQEILLAILGNFEGESSEIIMEKILLRLQKLVKRKKDFQKFAFQLHVLSGLRKLHKIYQLKIRNMPLHFDLDIENDPFYLEGEEKGIEKGRDETKTKMDYNFVRNLLSQTDHSDEKIASLANVPLTFIEEVKKSLEKNKQ